MAPRTRRMGAGRLQETTHDRGADRVVLTTQVGYGPLSAGRRGTPASAPYHHEHAATPLDLDDPERIVILAARQPLRLALDEGLGQLPAAEELLVAVDDHYLAGVSMDFELV